MTKPGLLRGTEPSYRPQKTGTEIRLQGSEPFWVQESIGVVLSQVMREEWAVLGKVHVRSSAVVALIDLQDNVRPLRSAPEAA